MLPGAPSKNVVFKLDSSAVEHPLSRPDGFSLRSALTAPGAGVIETGLAGVVQFCSTPSDLQRAFVVRAVEAYQEQHGKLPSKQDLQKLEAQAAEIDGFYNPSDGRVHVLRMDSATPDRMLRVLETSKIVHELVHRNGGGEVHALNAQLQYLSKNGYDAVLTDDGHLLVERSNNAGRGTVPSAIEIERCVSLVYGDSGAIVPLQPIIGHFGRLQRIVAVQRARHLGDSEQESLARQAQPTIEQLKVMIGVAQFIVGDLVTFHRDAGRFGAPMWGSATSTMQREVRIGNDVRMTNVPNVTRGMRFDPPHPLHGGLADHGLGNNQWHMHVFDNRPSCRTQRVDIKLAYQDDSLKIQGQVRIRDTVNWADISKEEARHCLALVREACGAVDHRRDEILA